MKKFSSKKLLCLLLCAAALFSLCALPAAAASAPVITGYTSSMPSVTKGSAPSFLVHVKDTGVLTSSVTAADIDISRLVDSFSAGTVSDPEIESEPADPLAFRFMISGAAYSGSGNNLRFMAGYRSISGSYTELSLSVRECVEYSEPSYGPEEPYVIPQPIAEIDRTKMDTVKPGETFTLTATIRNTSKTTAMSSPVVTFTPSEAFLILDSTPSKVIPNIKQGETASVSIKLQALRKIDSPSQSVSVKLDFSYYAGDPGTVSGSASQTLLIPVQTSAPEEQPELGAPVAVITRENLETVSANQAFTLNLNIRNAGETAIEKPVLSVSPASALAMMDATMTRLLEDIAPGASVTVPVQLKALDSITSPSLPVALELNYRYAGGSGSASETVFIPAVVNKAEEKPDDPVHIEGATPNVIVSQYSYGDEPQVAAGSSFDLAMEFRNTSAYVPVENIVMTVSTGEGLAISSSSNTMYYSRLAAGATQDQVIGITVLPTAKTGSAAIDLSFSYEYVDNQQRCKVSTTQKIAIPVYQPDRFEVELPALPQYVSAYEEMYLSLPYVNKGKSEVNNVRAELVSPDGSVTAINGVQNLGNFAPGSSGTIDFIFTPQMSGQVDFSFAITYEDPNAQEKTVEFPVSLFVEEPYYPEYDPSWDEPAWDEPVEENAGIPWWVWVIAGVVVAAAVIFIIVKVSRKKKKNGPDLDSFVWEDAPAEETVEAGGKK